MSDPSATRDEWTILQRLLDRIDRTDDEQLVAALAVLVKDYARYLVWHPREDARMFMAVYEAFARSEAQSGVGKAYFRPAEELNLPHGIVRRARSGDFAIAELNDPSLVAEWTLGPGRHLRKRFAAVLHDIAPTIDASAAGGQELRCAAAILHGAFAPRPFWYPLAVYLGLLLARRA